MDERTRFPGRQGQLELALRNSGVRASRKQSRTALEISARANKGKGIRAQAKTQIYEKYLMSALCSHPMGCNNLAAKW